MRRKKKSEIDDLIGYLVKSSIDDLAEQISEEKEIEEVELTPDDLASAYMEIMQAFMAAGFTRDEAFELLLNSI